MYSTITLFTWLLSAMYAAYLALNSFRLDANMPSPMGTDARQTAAMRQSMATSHAASPRARSVDPESSGIIWASGTSIPSILSRKTFFI